jgi:hypothetical protein
MNQKFHQLTKPSTNSDSSATFGVFLVLYITYTTHVISTDEKGMVQRGKQNRIPNVELNG